VVKATVGQVAYVALAGFFGYLVPIEAHFLKRGFVMLSLGQDYRQPFDFSRTVLGLGGAIAFASAALVVSSSAPFYRTAFIVTILGLLFLAWRYRLLAAIALIVAVTAQLLSSSKRVGWRRLAIPYWASFLFVLLMPVDMSLRREPGAFGFVRVEDGVWAQKPPDVGSSGMVGLVCYGQHAPRWLWIW
jgi:hypothetical protein